MYPIVFLYIHFQGQKVAYTSGKSFCNQKNVIRGFVN